MYAPKRDTFVPLRFERSEHQAPSLEWGEWVQALLGKVIVDFSDFRLLSFSI